MREGACIGVATMPQPWTLRLTLNSAALAAGWWVLSGTWVGNVCVLLLQDLLQSCSRGGGGEWRTYAMLCDFVSV